MSSWGENSGSDWSGTSSSTDYGYSEIKKPPKWPLILQILIIATSAVLFFVGPVFFKTEKLVVFAICYLLTPFLVVLCLAILRTVDLKNGSLPWYDRGLGKTYVKLSGRLSLLSFIMAAPIIWSLAIEIVN